MARSAAGRLLASSRLHLGSSHCHLRLRHPPLLLLPTSRSKTTSRKPPRAQARRKVAPAPAGSGRPGPPGARGSLFQEISELVASVTDDVALRPRRNGGAPCDDLGAAAVGCTEGDRGFASEGAALPSTSIAGSISDRVVLGDRADDRSHQSCGTIANAAEVLCREPGDTGMAVDSDVDNISAMVHRITAILRSEAPGPSVEHKLESLGANYTPNLVNMVLKRCFKFRQLGFWFFHWAKRLPDFHHTTETYNTMLYIVGEARSFGIMEELMGEMDREMCPKDIKTWTILLSSYGKERQQIGKMLSTFEAMRKSESIWIDSKVYRKVLHALCKANKPELALEFYKDMPSNMEVGTDILRLLMCCLAKSDNTAEGVYLIRDDMIEGMQHPEDYCYTEALRSFCIAEKFGEAWKVFQKMKHKSMANSSALENLLRGLCRAGRMDEALQVTEYMKRTSGLNSTTFSFLINGYLRKREHIKALDLLREMREYGCVPLASSYTQVMQHLFAIDQCEEACGLFEEMQKNSVEPDIVTFTSLICGHVRSGHISKAWDVFRNINKNGQKPTLKAYTVFMRELCKASRHLEAVALLKEMLEYDFRPSERTFYWLISDLRDKSYLEEAKYVERMRASFNLRSPRDGLQFKQMDSIENVYKFQKMRKSNPQETELALEFTGSPSDQNGKVSSSTLSDDTHQKELQDYSDGDVEEICRILSSDDWGSTQQALEMRSVHFSPNLVDAILKRCKRNSRAALKFFSWVWRRPYYMPTTETYNAAIKLAGSAKDFRHMWYLYREMLRSGCFPTVDTWNIMVCQYGNAGLSEKAFKTFCGMKEFGFLPDKTTYNHLIMYLTRSKGRKIDVAVTIFQEMCRAGHIPDNRILFMYLLALCECRKIADAASSVVSLCERGFSVQAGYSIFLTSLCRADRMEEALHMFDSIEKHGCSRDQYMYGSLIHALLRRDKFEDAVAKLTEMNNEGMLQSTHIYTSFIVYYFQKRDVVKALDVLREMKENGCQPTVVTYSALIRGYMGMGMVSEAWDVFQQMKLKGPAPDYETYSMFMSCLCKAGRSEDGLHLIHDMSDCGFIPSAINFKTVVHGLNVEGKHELADSVLRSKWHLRKQRKISC